MSNDRFEINVLLDFYGNLLTEKQQQICGYYYRDDYTLQEIADMEGISRSAVHDMIRRSREELFRFEDKLNLLPGFKKRMLIYEKIKHYSHDEVILELVEQCIRTETEGG